MFFATDNVLVRVSIRSCAVPLAKYVLVHVFLRLAVKSDIVNKDAMFLILTPPLAFCGAIAHTMALSAVSASECVVMEMTTMVMELFE